MGVVSSINCGKDVVKHSHIESCPSFYNTHSGIDITEPTINHFRLVEAVHYHAVSVVIK